MNHPFFQEVRDLLVNIQEVTASYGAFAALRADGQLVSWGNPLYGGPTVVEATGGLVVKIGSP